MMNYRSTNLVILNGRLGQDSQVKQIAENRFMVTFSIATSSSSAPATAAGRIRRSGTAACSSAAAQTAWPTGSSKALS